MIEFNHARRFTLPEVQTLFRALVPYIESIPNVYGSDGTNTATLKAKKPSWVCMVYLSAKQAT